MVMNRCTGRAPGIIGAAEAAQALQIHVRGGFARRDLLRANHELRLEQARQPCASMSGANGKCSTKLNTKTTKLHKELQVDFS